MAKNFRHTNMKNKHMAVIRNNINKYRSIWEFLQSKMDDELETVYMLLFDNTEKLIAAENITVPGTSTEGSVQHDEKKIEEIFNTLKSVSITKWGLAHNHPYVEHDGEWVETLVSPGDMVVTRAIKNVALQIDDELEYVGHYIANKEDVYEKVICIEDGFKYNNDVILAIEDGK